MSRAMRGRVAVNLGADASAYQPDPMPGFRIVGTVTDADGTGALGQRISNGDWLRINQGRITRLIQHKVLASIAKSTNPAVPNPQGPQDHEIQ